MPIFTNILVAMNESAAAQHAASIAIELAAESGARLCFCHVADEALERASEDPGAVGELLRSEGEVLLEAVVGRATERGVTAEIELASGDIVHGILHAATERQADLIVTGTNSRSGLARLMLGSVAEGVLHGTELPVLIVRAKESE